MKENNSCLESPKVHNVSNDDSELLSQMFHTLMPFKVREILLVSSLYDAFIIEEEGLISEMVVGEYGQLHLSSPPRVTRVSSGKNALSKVEKNKYDLVITMSKNIGMDPFEFGKKIKKIYPDLPVILLATETSDLNLIQQKEGKTGVDKAFFWNGDSSLFLAIIKYIEDKINVCFDTVTSNVQVIIMLEDSIRDYSMFLPIIYTEIVQQTERSISEDLNEMQRLVRRRGRPKILLAETFEEGMKVYEQYKDYLLIGGESLGGKGRGIAFIRSLLARYNFEKKYKNITITVPSTVVIGTEEFDKFIAENDLHKFVNEENISDSEIAQAFLKGSLSKELKAKLAHLLQHFTSPLAIRSSGILEDSSNHPFAGLYATYMLPNKHKDDKVRLKQLCQAIKLVHASVFYKDARVYIQSTASKIEEEKMAVIVQELVGREYRGRFYPTFSGVVQSYNFYPVSHQTYEDGITSVAMGLGKTVVGGERVLRFSPRYPNIIPDFSTTESILENSQRNLYALNTAKKDFKLSEKDDSTLIKLNINDIENDGTLRFIASTYDRNDGMIRDGMDGQGSRLITFAGILKYDVFPLASLLQDIMDIGQKGMGRPVEIEFAVTFDEKHKNHATFSILQIRPLVISHEHYEIAWDKNEENREDVFIRSDQALGNGVIDTIKDIVYVPPKSFDSSKTIEIADEVGIINKTLVASSSLFILIGPGRWGTQDRWLGIPVRWSQISGVRVMVETALKNFNIKPSQGTHFFQNIISREIGYINTTFDSQESFIDWEWLENQKTQKELKFIRHIRLSNPLVIKLDGRYGRALVMKPET